MEWLTTGQMIDTLKVGEVAECVNDHIYQNCKVTREKSGLQFERDAPFEITVNAFTAKWRILPNYVSFEDAMKAYEKGKIPKYHGNIENFSGLTLSEIADREIHAYALYKGKWTIES